jgi:dTDP-4-dehydrorhamnose 3,5-epimerase
MRFTETRLSGAFIVEIEPHRDERGSFARTFCRREFQEGGLPTEFVQCSLSTNRARGTLRGMHWQGEPAPEGKLVRCTRGAVYDVIIDLRPRSPTYLQWLAVELTCENALAVFVPAGFAHGYQTLVPESDVFYQMTEFYQPDLQRGVRWNDPAFGIDWPIPVPILSPRDAGYPDFQPHV